MARAIPRYSLLAAVEERLERTPLLALTGPRGCGKTHLLETLRARNEGGAPAVLLQLEPLASTPEILERELRRLAGAMLPKRRPTRSANPFDAALDLLRRREEGSLLLLDDFTELRTLSYFPGVDDPLPRMLEALEQRGPTVVTSRLSFWLAREIPELPRIEVPPVTVEELEAAGIPDAEAVRLASGGLAVHASRLAETMEREGLDARDALVAELSDGGRIEAECRATIAELLHRARGYNACKAVLRVLSEKEGLKLTEVARGIERTAGSTRDYLRWLEEVDLIRARHRRFFWADPVLRLWARVHRGGVLPTEGGLRREVDDYLETTATAALPTDAATTPAGEESSEPYVFPRTKAEDLVEID